MPTFMPLASSPDVETPIRYDFSISFHARLAAIEKIVLTELPMPTHAAPSSRLKKLGHRFFRRQAIEVARKAIGKILVHQREGKEYRARIVETEAYVGAHGLACHASKGRTRRTEIMFGPGGYTYVYFIYGMYHMLNFVTGKSDDPQAVLIRGALPLDGWQADLSGPGKLTRAMHITRADNGVDLTGDQLFVLDDPRYRPRLNCTRRIGVDYAQEWKDALLRFVDARTSGA
jgi:DNA-3-methyladenine glycosylase